MGFTAVGTIFSNTPGSSSFTISPQNTGDFLLVEVIIDGTTSETTTAVTGGGVSTWTEIASHTGTYNSDTGSVWMGTVTTAGSATLSITTTGSGGTPYIAGQEFASTGGAMFDQVAYLDTGNTSAMPSFTPANAGELYFCYAVDQGNASRGTTSGYVYELDSTSNALAYNLNCTEGVSTHPVWGDDGLYFGIAVLIKGSGGGSNTATASLTIVPAMNAQASPGGTAQAALTVTPEFLAVASGGSGALSIAQIVPGNVINDYGLDNVPFTVSTPGTGTMLAAFVGWNAATSTAQSSGKTPAVNVTDSAGNLWRQAGITAVDPLARCALWVADNPRQTEWVSVALTGWGYSTAYTIVELDGVPSSLGQISLDFVSPITSDTPVKTLTIPSQTASTSDLVLGVVTTGGPGGPLTVPTGWTGIQAIGGATSGDVTTYSMYRQSAAGAVTLAPSWANSVPASGVMAGIKITSAAPSQPNPNFPAIRVEAAFGATPGDWTQSVDYTYDVGGLTWTDISQYTTDEEGQSTISVKRGRQYELSQEETGTLEVQLDNHTGIFTYSNTASTFYPNVIPGTPLRVTAWFNGVQYPVGFGYAEKWPQEWPKMPQWGFSRVTATDAYGPLAACNLFSAVISEIRKDSPYAYFPTTEQYEFTTQSLDPVQAPLDANGLIAVNYAFGNNRFGAYRDGYDQPVTVGQALNLMGDENTTLGATTYTGQEIADNGPGMFYFDNGIPTNANGKSFAVEFWFAWGNTSSFACTMLSAWASPSSFFTVATSAAPPSAGGVLTVGINTPAEGNALEAGFFVNGTEISGGTFNQTSYAPQHFALNVAGTNVTAYLNGVQQPNTPSVATIPMIRAFALGPARFSYDVSGMVVYNGYNYTSGHVAWYPHALNPTVISNHYESGATGFVGDPAPGRFAQVLTWGELGLKRGGTAWYNTYGNYEGTFMSEAYDYDGSSAADILSQITQSEGGRCYIQANGSIVYAYRWSLYDQPVVAQFGDQPGQLPFENNTSFAVDNQFIFNVVNATQQRGPNQDLYIQENNFQSQNQFFMRSGISYQSYAMLPFDVSDLVNWSVAKYQEPHDRVVQVTIDVAGVQASNPTLFPTILSLELNQTITVTRTPIGGSQISLTGVIQQISHEFGATNWKTTLEVTPLIPEANALIADDTGNDTAGSSYLSW